MTDRNSCLIKTLFGEDLLKLSIGKCNCVIYIPESSYHFNKEKELERLDSGQERHMFSSKPCELHLCEVTNLEQDCQIHVESSGNLEALLILDLREISHGGLIYKADLPKWHVVQHHTAGRLRTLFLNFSEDETKVEEFTTFYDRLLRILNELNGQKKSEEEEVIPAYILAAFPVTDLNKRENKLTSGKRNSKAKIKDRQSRRSWIPNINFIPNFLKRSRSSSVSCENLNVDSEAIDAVNLNRVHSKVENVYTEHKSVLSVHKVEKEENTTQKCSEETKTSTQSLAGDHNSPKLHTPAPFTPGEYVPFKTFDFQTIPVSVDQTSEETEDQSFVENRTDDLTASLRPLRRSELPQSLDSILNSEQEKKFRKCDEGSSEYVKVVNKRYLSLDKSTDTSLDDESYEQMTVHKESMASKSGGKYVSPNERTAKLLETAISSGDQVHASEYAAQLARAGVRLNIVIQDTGSEQEKKDTEFNLKVFIEDKEASAGSINLKVKASDTVSDLKNKMLIKHMFPVEVQRWIIGKRLPGEHETLFKCGIRGQGYSAYLYLVSAKSVGLSKQDFEDRMAQTLLGGALPAAGAAAPPPCLLPGTQAAQGYVAMEHAQAIPAPQPTPQPLLSAGTQNQPVFPASLQVNSMLTSPNQPQANKAPSPKQVKQDVPFEIIEAPPRPPRGQNQPFHEPLHRVIPAPAGNPGKDTARPVKAGDRVPVVHLEEEQDKQVGWQCPACTFLNVPTRPGCEVCTHPRPVEYKIPEGYVMTEEEKRRIVREELLEQQTREAGGEGRETENISEEQLDQMLQFNDALQEALRRSQQNRPQGEAEDVTLARGNSDIPRYPIEAGEGEDPFELMPRLDSDDENVPG